MKLKIRIRQKPTWLGTFGLLLMLSLSLYSAFIANAQSEAELVTHSGESEALTLAFSPPTEFFENAGTSLDQFLRRRNAQPDISVTGAGASYQIGAAQPLPEQKIRRAVNRIEVQGAGSVKDVVMGVSPVDVTVNELVITAIGAGSVRNTQLEMPVVANQP